MSEQYMVVRLPALPPGALGWRLYRAELVYVLPTWMPVWAYRLLPASIAVMIPRRLDMRTRFVCDVTPPPAPIDERLA